MVMCISTCPFIHMHYIHEIFEEANYYILLFNYIGAEKCHVCLFFQVNRTFPGLVLAATTSIAGFQFAHHAGIALMSVQGIATAASPLSGVAMSIIGGLVVHNVLRIPERLRLLRPNWDVTEGLRMCTTTVLRAGIVL